MRPPLIEISINQPKVVVLGKDKKGTGGERAGKGWEIGAGVVEASQTLQF